MFRSFIITLIQPNKSICYVIIISKTYNWLSFQPTIFYLFQFWKSYGELSMEA